MPRQNDGPQKSSSLPIILAIVGGWLVAVAAGGAFLFGRARPEQPPVTPRRPMPEIVVGEGLKASGLKFGEWVRGDFTCSTTATLPPNTGERLPANGVLVRCFGPGGVKLRDGWSTYPAISSGESVKFTIGSHEPLREVAEMRIDLK